nr:MAG TPA: hypothetical protein [Caudoviricetes sp.]
MNLVILHPPPEASISLNRIKKRGLYRFTYLRHRQTPNENKPYSRALPLYSSMDIRLRA